MSIHTARHDVALHLCETRAKKRQMEQRAVVRVLTLNVLKAQKMQMELTNMYSAEAVQISALKKWGMRFLQRRTYLGGGSRSDRAPILI
jgi:hypothetical protein